MSLYERVGGEKTIAGVVDTLFELLMADEKLAQFFKNTDMGKEKQKQIQYLIKLAGGPHHYEGKDMKEAHSKSHVAQEHFNRSWQLMAKALEKNGVKPNQVNEFHAKFFSLEKEVVQP